MGPGAGEDAEDDVAQKSERPVLSGLAALVTVGLVVGVILGGATLFATNVLGFGGSDEASGEAGEQESLYLPEPQPTETPTGPSITLAPGEEEPSPEESPSPTETKSKKPKKQISLTSPQNQAAPMARIDLTGTYQQGEGAILMVQRHENGSWSDFGVTMSVSGGTFSTYVQTGRTGEQRFRVVDTDSGKASNVVRIQVG